MKKTLRFVLFSMLMLLAVPMSAQTVVTFVAGTDMGTQTNAGNGADEMQKDGITISVTKGALAAAQYRFAKGETMTITSSVGNITQVVFTCTASGDAQYGPGNFTDCTSGSYMFEDAMGLWMGDAAQFSMTASKAQVRCSTIQVVIGGEVVDPHPGFEFDTEMLKSAEIVETENQLMLKVEMELMEGVTVPGQIVCDFTGDECTNAYFTMTFPSEDMAKMVYEETMAEWEEGDPVITLDGATMTADLSEDFVGMTKSQVRALFEQVKKSVDQGGTLIGDGSLENPFTPADANLVASGLEPDETTDVDFYIKGKISSIKYTFSAQYGTATFFISADGSTEGSQFQCYSVLYLENKAWVDGNTQIKVGDEVIVCGKLVNYKGTTPETASKQAYIYSLNGVTKNEGGETPEPVVETITVAKALEIISGLEAGASTAETYRVKGYVISVSEISTQYGNATFVMADDKNAETGLTVFCIYGFDGQKITNEQLLKEGDEVVVEARLQKYAKNDVETPETVQSGSKIISINGKTSEEEKPEPVVETITVEQALDIITDELEDGKTTTDYYYVQGYVISISEISPKIGDEGYGNATFVIADNKNDVTGLTVFRAKGFNNELITDAEFVKVGDEVVIYGKLQRYVKNDVMTPEVSSCYVYSINGSASSIVSVKSNTTGEAIFNLQGQRVATAQKGLYIIGGKKYLVK